MRFCVFIALWACPSLAAAAVCHGLTGAFGAAFARVRAGDSVYVFTLDAKLHRVSRVSSASLEVEGLGRVALENIALSQSAHRGLHQGAEVVIWEGPSPRVTSRVSAVAEAQHSVLFLVDAPRLVWVADKFVGTPVATHAGISIGDDDLVAILPVGSESNISPRRVTQILSAPHGVLFEIDGEDLVFEKYVHRLADQFDGIPRGARVTVQIPKGGEGEVLAVTTSGLFHVAGRWYARSFVKR